MITVPSLDPCTDILDTDKIMITHQNGTTETISGEEFNKRNKAVVSENTTLTGAPLKTKNVVRVLFTADQSAVNSNTAMVISYNSANKTVKVCKNGVLTNYLPFEVSSGVYKYCQAYTELDLLYDGTNFIIMGNPVVFSGTDYTIFADGLRRINNYDVNSKGMITSNAVKEALEETIPIPTDAVLHYSFDDVPDYPDGTADVRLIDNNTYQIQATAYKFLDVNQHGTTFANVNGNVQITIPTGNDYGAQILNTYIENKCIKLKINVTSISGVFRVKDGTGPGGITLGEITQNGIYEYTFKHDSSPLYNNFFFLTSGATSSVTFTVEQIYIGDGSYSTPIIDNSGNGINATNNGGLAVQGLSGKGVYLNQKNANLGAFNLTPNFTISVWIKPDNNTTALLGNVYNKTSQIILRNGVSWRDTLMVYLYGETSTLLDNFDIGNLLPPNVWTHIVLVRSGISFRAYRNGIQTHTAVLADSTLRQNTNDFIIGNTTNTRPQSLDDFQIFNRALSAEEVKALYLNKANTPKYYNLNNYELAKKLPQPPTTDGNYTLKVNVASGVETYSWT